MPPTHERSNHFPQKISDISSADDLLRFAAAGQLDSLLKRFNQGDIALGGGLGTTKGNANATLARELKNGLTSSHLQGLDMIIGAVAQRTDGMDAIGGLSSLELRLSRKLRDKISISDLMARVPPSWARKILASPASSEIDVLIQASALLSEFIPTCKMDPDDTTVLNRYGEEMIRRLAGRLMLISAGPPAARNYDAQTLLALLASYAFDQVSDGLERKLRNSPMSWRIWRAITKLVILSGDSPHSRQLRGWVSRLVHDSGELRKTSLYAGSAYDLELAITVPAAWSPAGNDWVGAALYTRARDDEATIRERGTAAMGLWQRAVDERRPGLKKTEAELRRLISEFREDPGSRPDAAAGLRWVALTLEHVINNQHAVCNDWPDPGETWFQNVQAAAAELDQAGIPAHLLEGTKSLFRHIILQNAGVYRRQAIETVVTSGLNKQVARALGTLLRTETNEAWLRIRAESALGFMQVKDPGAEMDLTRACQRAYQALEQTPGDNAPPRSQVSEMHASLFAVGDCFGVQGAEEEAKSARERLRPVLAGLAGTRGDRAKILRRAVRAAAYMLIVTAQPAPPGRKDLSQELLEELSNHPDLVTAKLSRWALGFRFAETENGTMIRPLLDAATYGESDDIP
jgi:hypothetical protein